MNPGVRSIYNGIKAIQNQFPYIVLTNSPQFYCAGVLISQRHVLTAAHCLMSVTKGGSIKVTLGAHEYYGASYSDGELVKSDKFWIHENFSMPTAVNDIGLIELPKSIIPSKTVNFIGIETNKRADYNFKDNQIVISGWGYTRASKFADTLMYTFMDLIPMHKCLSYKSNYIEKLTMSHICAMKITGIPCK